MRIRINISLKKAVLDTQGKAIESALNKNLGFSQISEVRQGKQIEMEIAETDMVKIKNIVDEICDKVLVNKIIENYDFEILNHK
jgi:phosphoribosylformylglycinamidine synthase